MKYEQFLILVKTMKAIWPNEHFLKDKFAVDLWYKALKDLTADELTMAINKCVTESRFPPTVAELRENAILTKVGLKDWSQGWGEVVRAVGRYGRNQEAEALNSFDRITMITVRRIGWKAICNADENDPSIRANFRMIYEQVYNEAKEDLLLSQDLKEEIEFLRVKQLEHTGEEEQ